MKLEELKKIREKAQQKIKLREGKAKFKIVVNMGTSGIAAGAREVLAAFLDELEKRDINNVIVTQSGDKGVEIHVPLVEIEEEEGKTRVLYGKVTPEIARQIVAQHIVNGKPLTDYIIHVEKE